MSPLARSARRRLRPLRRRLRPSPSERRIAGLGLAPGAVAIDCGANVGHVTDALAARAAVVHAFEPDPAAFAELEARVAGRPNVMLYPCAVLDRDATVRLYLQRGADGGAVPQGSSLLAFKGNVDPGSWVDVRAVDLARFVLELPRRVALLKLDVEGVEHAILHRLVDSGALERIDLVLVELHDAHVPELREETARLRARLAESGYAGRVRTDWL